MDLSGQQGNRELVNNVKIEVRRPRQLDKLSYFRVGRVKVSCREAYQKKIQKWCPGVQLVKECCKRGPWEDTKIKCQEPQQQYQVARFFG